MDCWAASTEDSNKGIWVNFTESITRNVTCILLEVMGGNLLDAFFVRKSFNHLVYCKLKEQYWKNTKKSTPSNPEIYANNK